MDCFFQQVSRYSEAELIDIVYARYHGAEYVAEMCAESFYKLLNHIHEEKDEQRAWELYKVNFGRMNKDNYESYEDYKRRLKGAYIDKRTDADILDEVEQIRREFEQKEDTKWTSSN